MERSGAARTLSQWSGFSFGRGVPSLPMGVDGDGSGGGGGGRFPLENGGGGGGGGVFPLGNGGGNGGGGIRVWFDPEEESDKILGEGKLFDVLWVPEDDEPHGRGGGSGGGVGGGCGAAAVDVGGSNISSQLIEASEILGVEE